MPPAFPSSSNLRNEEELQEYILLVLGAPQVKVELVREDLQEAVAEAKRWYAGKKGVVRSNQLAVTSNETEYDLPGDVDTVLDVSFNARMNDFSRVIDPLGLLDASIPYSLFPAPQAGGLFSTYVQALQYLEISQRVTGGEKEWFQEGRKLYIMPAPKESGTIIYQYKTNDFSVNQLNELDHDLVKRYAVAWAKIKLGRVYTKYSSWPGAQGTVGLNGSQLLQEGLDDMKSLSEELQATTYPIPFVTG